MRISWDVLDSAQEAVRTLRTATGNDADTQTSYLPRSDAERVLQDLLAAAAALQNALDKEAP